MAANHRGPRPVNGFSLVVVALMLLASTVSPSFGDTSLSLYYFSYYYNDGSGDSYYGLVFAPTGMLYVSERLYTQPESMGGQKLSESFGYYYITAAYSGYDSAYDAMEYILSYYDGDTGKTSYTLHSGSGEKTANTALTVANRRYTAESGYVYDPSVPDNDAYFGDADVCYSFSSSDDTGNNFLAAYITDLPYWDQPSSYPGSCSEVAGATLLSYWDSLGYSNLISTDWQTLWPDNSGYYQDSPASYVTLIGTLATGMNWDYGTYSSDIGPGLQTYARSQGYTNFAYSYYYVSGSRSSGYDAYTAALDAGRPVIVDLVWGEGGHSTVGRGYWNDGQILVDFGWGLDYTNQKVDWKRTSYGSSYSEAMVYDLIYFY
jgi:hypothetical protein